MRVNVDGAVLWTDWRLVHHSGFLQKTAVIARFQTPSNEFIAGDLNWQPWWYGKSFSNRWGWGDPQPYFPWWHLEYWVPPSTTCWQVQMSTQLRDCLLQIIHQAHLLGGGVVTANQGTVFLPPGISVLCTKKIMQRWCNYILCPWGENMW